MTFLVFEERHSLCPTKDIPCVRGNNNLCVRRKIPRVRRKTFLVFEDDETPICGRTGLRKGVSEAKFDAEADFDVKKSLAPPKSAENHEKSKKNCEKNSEQKKIGVKKSKVANRPKRVFPNFRGDLSEVRGANGRSKFEGSVDGGAY